MAIYMRFDGVKGDATQAAPGLINRMIAAGTIFLDPDDAVGWIALTHVNWDIKWPITTRANVKNNTREGKHPKVDEVVVNKNIDSSTKYFVDSICGSNTPNTCYIYFVRTGQPGRIYLEIKLKEALITNWTIVSDGDTPVETININFTEFEMSFIPSDEENLALAPKRSQYKIIEDK